MRPWVKGVSCVIIRCTGGPRLTTFSIGPCVIEPSLHRVRRNGDLIQLEPKIMQVLVRLAEAQGEVVKKEELIRSVWAGTFVTDYVLTRSISLLRKALGDDSEKPQFIETIARSGYRLMVPVCFATQAADPETSRALEASPDSVENAPSAFDTPRRAKEGPRSFILRHSYLPAAAILILLLCGALLLILRPPRSPASGNRTMIAVLPFTNLSGDAGEEYFSAGITEEVITSLSRVGSQQLAVVAPASAMRYEQSQDTPAQIGNELGAEYVLKGSVQRSGTRVRVTAQLIRVRDQVLVWADGYDSELKDVLGLQAQISQSVAQAIRVQLGIRPGPLGTVNPEAYQLYLRGRYFLDRSRGERLRNALNNFQQSVALDPDFARAWGGVALSYELLEYSGMVSPRESYPHALSAATRAVELDPESAEAHLALGYIHEHYEWNWDEEDREVERAMELDPSYELARQWFSYALLQRGETARALEEMRRALSLDPLSPLARINMAARLERAGRRDEATRELQEATALDPRNPAPFFGLTDLYEKQRELEKAAAAYRRALQLDDQPVAAVQFDALQKQIGFAAAFAEVQHEQIKSQLAELNRSAALGQYTAPGRYAVAYARLGRARRTLEWLQRAYDEHASIMLELSDPVFDFVRENPQFKELVRRVNMPGPGIQRASR